MSEGQHSPEEIEQINRSRETAEDELIRGGAKHDKGKLILTEEQLRDIELNFDPEVVQHRETVERERSMIRAAQYKEAISLVSIILEDLMKQRIFYDNKSNRPVLEVVCKVCLEELYKFRIDDIKKEDYSSLETCLDWAKQKFDKISKAIDLYDDPLRNDIDKIEDKIREALEKLKGDSVKE